MPTKRTRIFRRRQYPAAIEALLRGEPLEETEENRSQVLAAAFFHEYKELGEELERLAGRQLAVWRAKK